MRRVLSTSISVITAALLVEGACAMDSNIRSEHCRVFDAGKLPAASGGAIALCAAIEQAASEKAPGVEFTAAVKVISSSRLTATLTKGGRKLPEQNFASMDRDLSPGSFERFAAALADQLANAH